MPNTKVDPITLEIMLHKLWQIADEAALVLKRVSGSTVVIEAKDIIAALCDASGQIIVSGVGVTLHCAIARYGIEHILKKYGKDPGVQDGDVWFMNDPYICAMHEPDGFVLTPIFYEGELVAWSVTMTHLMDISGADPGGFSPSARDVYQEGFRFGGVRLATAGNINREIIDSIVNMSRVPGIVELDLRAQIASSNAVRQRMGELIKHYGVGTFKTVCREAISYAESRLKARIKTLRDGQWQSVIYLDTDTKTDKVYKVMCTLSKKGDNLTFDFTGTDGQTPGYINVAGKGGQGGIFGAVGPMLAYDMPWSQGVLNPLKMIIPPGTVVSATFPAACSMGTIGGGALALYASVGAISKMLNSADNFQDFDVTALWGAVGCVVILSGKDGCGEPFVLNFMDTEALGAGATPERDGMDCAGHFMIPGGSCPNVETHELAFPVLYLYRRRVIDSGGAGKFRGGTGGEWAVIIHGAPGDITVNALGFGTEAGTNLGMCGGYPGIGSIVTMARDSDIREKMKKGIIPWTLEEVRDLLKSDYGIVNVNHLTTMREGDVITQRWSGGGGYGDVLDRDPERVLEDVVNNVISPAAASELYGVVINPRTYKVDVKKTEQKREALRKERLR